MAEPGKLVVEFDPESLQALQDMKQAISDEWLRLEAMKLAVANGRGSHSLPAHAGQIEAYIRYGRLKDQQGYVSLASELFLSPDGDVVSFQGENFYRACNNFVRTNEDGGRSHCVKRAGHPSDECEDYDGYLRSMDVID